MLCFFFIDTSTSEIYPLSLHDSLPISMRLPGSPPRTPAVSEERHVLPCPCPRPARRRAERDLPRPGRVPRRCGARAGGTRRRPAARGRQAAPRAPEPVLHHLFSASEPGEAARYHGSRAEAAELAASEPLFQRGGVVMSVRMASFSEVAVALILILAGVSPARAQQVLKLAEGETLTISGFISATLFNDRGSFAGGFGNGQNAEVAAAPASQPGGSGEHTSEIPSLAYLLCRLLP